MSRGVVDQPVVDIQRSVVELQLVEIRDGHHGVRAGQDVNWAACVVGTDRDVERLREVRDLSHLAYASAPQYVRHQVLCQAVSEDWNEVPAAVKSLTHAERHVHGVSHGAEGLVAVRLHRLLEPADFIWLKSACEPDGGRHVEVAVRVDQYFDLRPDRLPHRGNSFDTQRGAGC